MRPSALPQDIQGFSGGALHTTARPDWELSVGFCCQPPLNSEGRLSKLDDFSTWLLFTSAIGHSHFNRKLDF